MQKVTHTFRVLHKSASSVSFLSVNVVLSFSMAVLRQPIKDATRRQENSDAKFTSNSKGEILPTNKGDLEYVNLFKVSRNRYEDPRKFFFF